MSDAVIVYFEQDVIVKVLNYQYGYIEYDANINTIKRKILIPKTTRGTNIDFDKLLEFPTLRPIEIFHHDVSNGTFPVVSFRKLSDELIAGIDCRH